MSSLFRSLHNFSAKRENAVKEALVNTLNENIRDIQYEKKENDTLELCELSSALCTTLEAIFLNGLKDSLLWQTFVVIAGDEERRPDPSFWSPLLIFLHKQVIEQLHSLTQITSEIGLCRAWIRQSLNESLLSAYLHNIRKNCSALSPYYKKHALLRDSEGLESAADLVRKLETQFAFNLPVNSSLLNQWPDYALQLSGLWTPPLKSCPISSGIDVAASLTTDSLSIPTPQPVRTNELFSESISNSPFTRSSNFGGEDLNQRENLELFLQKVDEMALTKDDDTTEEAQETHEDNADESKGAKKKIKLKKERKRSRDHGEPRIRDNEEDVESPKPAHGNSLTNLMQTSWSSDQINQVMNTSSEDLSHGLEKLRIQRSVSMTSSTSSSLRSPLADRCSYNALLKKHERNRELDWTEVWEKFLNSNTTTISAAAGTHAGNDANETENFENMSEDSRTLGGDFEFVQNTALDKFDIVELQDFVEQLCKLPREPGLDGQGFLCKSCQHPLGIGYSNFRVCAFSGNYFCDKCMDLELTIIPSRIIYNWDFRKYSVSKRAMAFLAEFRYQPFIDLKLLNPEIYNAIDPMAELQSLRIRLNFIRAYLYTCGPASIEVLQQQFFGKEYLYEHIHLYSIGDLAMIQRGALYQQLQKAFKVGEGHVLKCVRCSVKGFICEICKSPRVLYPFHIDTTYRCETCGAVFHAHCLNSHQPCPKCERKRKYASRLMMLESIGEKDSQEGAEEEEQEEKQEQVEEKQEKMEEKQ